METVMMESGSGKIVVVVVVMTRLVVRMVVLEVDGHELRRLHG